MLIELLSLLCLLVPLQSEPADPDPDEDAPAQTQPATTQPAGGIIEGIVTNTMGGGISGAKVQLVRIEPPGGLIAEGVTNATGDIALRLETPVREKTSVRATVTKDGYAPFTQDVEIDPDEDLPFIDATLTGAARIRGQVRRADDNAPVAGARILCTTGARDIEATSDHRGRFTLEGVDQGSAVLVATAVGWATERVPVKVEEDETDVFIELKPERPVRIVAKRSDGQPAPNLLVEVVLQPSEHWMQVTTDADGRAELKGVAVTIQKLLMRYNGEGYVQMSGFEKAFTLPRPRATGTSPSDVAPVEIPLEVPLAAQIHGTVVDARGQPVLGVRVIAGREPYGYMPMIWTSQDGTYELGGLPTGLNVISFQHGDYATVIRECTLEAGQNLLMDASLDPGAPVRARVMDEAGQPIANAWVTVESWKGYTTLGMRTVTARDGTFEFPHAPAGELEISIERPGYATVREKFTAGAASRDVTLKKTRDDQEGTQPPRVAKLRIGDAVPEIVVTATDGKTYKLSDLNGKYVFIECWASWCGPCMAEVPNVKALREATKNNKDFVLIGINLDRERQAFDKAVQKAGIDWPQVTGPNSGAEKAFGTLDGFAIPYSCLISPDGKLLATELRGPGLVDEVKKHLGN